MITRGYGLTALAWLGTIAGCGGWVDLENPRDGGGGTTASGGTTGTAGKGSVPPEAGKTGAPSLPGPIGTGGSGSAEGPFLGLTPPQPALFPPGADGPGVTWSGTAIIDTGSLEAGALAGATEYCFRKPQSGSSCDWQSREPFVWIEGSGIVPLNGLISGALSYYPSAVSDDGKTVVGSFATANQPVAGLFRWSSGDGMTTLDEPTIDSSGPLLMSSDGRVVAGVVKEVGKSSPAHLQFRWSVTEGFQALADDASWPTDGEILSLSDDGMTIVGQIFGDAPAAFRWRPDSGAELLGALPEMESCTAMRATADGEAIFGYCQDAQQQAGPAFRWRAGEGMVPLGDEPSACVLRPGVAFSADADVVFGACAGEPLRLRRWTDGADGAELPLPTGSWAAELFSLGSNDAGSLAFGSLLPAGSQPGQVVNGSRAFRWTEASDLELLEPLAGHQLSAANMASSSGSAVIGRSSVANGVASKAMLWDEDGALDITAFLVSQGVDLQGFELQSAERIAVRGDSFLIQGITDVTALAGVWFARIPIER